MTYFLTTKRITLSTYITDSKIDSLLNNRGILLLMPQSQKFRGKGEQIQKVFSKDARTPILGSHSKFVYKFLLHLTLTANWQVSNPDYLTISSNKFSKLVSIYWCQLYDWILLQWSTFHTSGFLFFFLFFLFVIC